MEISFVHINAGFFHFFSLGIIYGVFSFANLFAPSVVAVIGPRVSMFVSGLLYRQISQTTHYIQQWIFRIYLFEYPNFFSLSFSGYIAVFIIPSTWSFYLTSVLIGMGAACEYSVSSGGLGLYLVLPWIIFHKADLYI